MSDENEVEEDFDDVFNLNIDDEEETGDSDDLPETEELTVEDEEVLTIEDLDLEEEKVELPTSPIKQESTVTSTPDVKPRVQEQLPPEQRVSGYNSPLDQKIKILQALLVSNYRLKEETIEDDVIRIYNRLNT
jgi:hypothetical protein